MSGGGLTRFGGKSDCFRESPRGMAGNSFFLVRHRGRIWTPYPNMEERGAFESVKTLLRNEVRMLSDILDLNSGQQRPGCYYLT